MPSFDQKVYKKEYDKNHREEKKASDKRYYENHKEEIKEQMKEYRKNHKEYYKEYKKEYNKNHKEQIREYKESQRKLPIHKNLKELLSYFNINIKTGICELKTGTKPYLNRGGYLHFIFKSKNYGVNRLVWMKANNKFIPKGLEIDHINDKRTDNRIENLQILTKLQNLAKRKY